MTPTNPASQERRATIERSPGIPIPGTPYSAGGGMAGATQALDDAVAQAAEALRDLYGMDVMIRFNSDRRSGGAWLRTHGTDGLDQNDDIGIRYSTWVAQAPHPRHEYVRDELDGVRYPAGTTVTSCRVRISARALRTGMRPTDGQTHRDEPMPDLEAAMEYLRENAAAPAFEG